MEKQKPISLDEAKRVGECLGIDWEKVDLEEFRQDLMGNPKTGVIDPETGLAYDSMLRAGKVILAHMQEIPDYCTRLTKLEEEVDAYRAGRRQLIPAPA